MSKNWKCNNCEHVHRKNVRNCKSCGNSILQQTTEPPTGTISRSIWRLKSWFR